MGIVLILVVVVLLLCNDATLGMGFEKESFLNLIWGWENIYGRYPVDERRYSDDSKFGC